MRGCRRTQKPVSAWAPRPPFLWGQQPWRGVRVCADTGTGSEIAHAHPAHTHAHVHTRTHTCTPYTHARTPCVNTAVISHASRLSCLDRRNPPGPFLAGSPGGQFPPSFACPLTCDLGAHSSVRALFPARWPVWLFPSSLRDLEPGFKLCVVECVSESALGSDHRAQLRGRLASEPHVDRR